MHVNSIREKTHIATPKINSTLVYKGASDLSRFETGVAMWVAQQTDKTKFTRISRCQGKQKVPYKGDFSLHRSVLTASCFAPATTRKQGLKVGEIVLNFEAGCEECFNKVI